MCPLKLILEANKFQNDLHDWITLKFSSVVHLRNIIFTCVLVGTDVLNLKRLEFWIFPYSYYLK